MKIGIWEANHITTSARAIIQNGIMITIGAAMAGYLPMAIKLPLSAAAAELNVLVRARGAEHIEKLYLMSRSFRASLYASR